MRSRHSIPIADGSHPLEHVKQLRSCILRTLRDLRRSVAEHRALSLPNLQRIFLRRWQALNLPPEESERGRTLGLAFIYTYYASRQPFRARPVSNGNHCCGG